MWGSGDTGEGKRGDGRERSGEKCIAQYEQLKKYLEKKPTPCNYLLFWQDIWSGEESFKQITFGAFKIGVQV